MVETALLQPGTVVADRTLVTRLGRGGEGEVWEVVAADGTRSALKLLRPEVLPASTEVRRRGGWLVRIDHPALVGVRRGGRFTSGTLAGWGFVEMDLIAGASLQQVPPDPDALHRLAPVAQALDSLHAGAWSDGVPLVHRDIKPGNLIDTGAGLVLVDPSTMRGLDTGDLTRVGTPVYVAPEVAGGRFGPLADVYSLSATAAALLTGRRGRALAEVLADPVGFGLPNGVVAGLSQDPARRPGSCRGVVEDVGDEETHLQSWDPRPGWVLPTLGVVLTSAVLAVVGGGEVARWAAGLAMVLHLMVHALTGRAALGLLAPPWAWGDLLAGLDADTDMPGSRVRWLADVVAGTLVLAVGSVAATVWTAGPDWVVAVVALGTVLLAWAATACARVRRRSSWALVWALWLPPRLLGALGRVLAGRR